MWDTPDYIESRICTRKVKHAQIAEFKERLASKTASKDPQPGVGLLYISDHQEGKTVACNARGQ